MVATRHRTFHQLWGNFLNIQNYTGGVAHTWSLAVEEHAYLLLVLVFVIAARRHTRMRHLFICLAVMATCAVAMTFYSVTHHYDPYNATHTRIDGILYGVMLAILYHYGADTLARLQRLHWLWIAIIAIDPKSTR